MREVVRNLKSDHTHIADVTYTRTAFVFGKQYRQPDPSTTRALCGVRIIDGVVMREGTKVRCRACRFVDGKQGVGVASRDLPNPEARS